MLLHMRDGMFTDPHGTAEIDRDYTLKFCVSVQDKAFRLQYPGVVNHDFESSESIDAFHDSLPSLFRTAHIGRDKDRWSISFQLSDSPVSLICVYICNRYPVASLRVQRTDRQPNTRGSSCDQCRRSGVRLGHSVRSSIVSQTEIVDAIAQTQPGRPVVLGRFRKGRNQLRLKGFVDGTLQQQSRECVAENSLRKAALKKYLLRFRHRRHNRLRENCSGNSLYFRANQLAVGPTQDRDIQDILRVVYA